MMEKETFAKRLSTLRLQKNVSAREMSLALGQSDSYINTIENGKAYPSMANFFYICEYLNVTPSQFFDAENQNPQALDRLVQDLKHLDARQMETISSLVGEFIRK